jgi:predicted nucleic acid-binding protein
MRNEYVLDSSAWMEYFGGTVKGKRVKELVQHKKIATSIIAVAEVAYAFEVRDTDFSENLRFMQSFSAILPLDIAICLRAALLKKQHRLRQKKFSLADGLHLATALKEKAVLLTTDADFEDAKDVMII